MRLPLRSRGAVLGGRGSRGGSVSVCRDLDLSGGRETLMRVRGVIRNHGDARQAGSPLGEHYHLGLDL
jgi:hypothetical protein